MFSLVLLIRADLDVVELFEMIDRKFGIVGIIIVLLPIGGLIIIHDKLTDQFYNTLSTFLYVKLTLRTDITLDDAGSLSWLFEVYDDGHWYPLKEIRKLPKDERKYYLINTANKIAKTEILDESNGV